MRPVCTGGLLLLASVSAGAGAQLAPKRTLAATAPQGCAALLTPVTSGSSTDDQETRRLIAAGQEASLNGDHAAARDSFVQAAKRSPNHAVLAVYLGRVYELLDSPTEAVKEYCRYLQLAPNARDADEIQGRIVRLTPQSQLAKVDEAKANFSSAVALLERRQYVAADSMFGSIAAELPNAPEPYYNRALSRAARGERRLAMEDFQKYFDLSSNPADRSTITTAVARLQDRVFSTGQAFVSGVAFPGMGQMSTGRPVFGVAVLGTVAAALVWGLSEEEGFEVKTFQDPFGNPYVDSLPRTTRPNVPIAASVAAALWFGSAYEAMSYARRSRARAESIIQLGPVTSPVVPGQPELFLAIDRRRLGAGVAFKLR